MNTHTNKKVVCVKDIPSNIIEEAIFILKSDETDCKNLKTSSARKEIILRETEDLVNEYSNEFTNVEFENKKNISIVRNLKLKILLSTIAIVLVCYLVSLIL